jgi:hypothetical protein
VLGFYLVPGSRNAIKLSLRRTLHRSQPYRTKWRNEFEVSDKSSGRRNMMQYKIINMESQ